MRAAFVYNVVAKTIKFVQLDAHPQDYLNFYCLGKQEEIPFKVGSSFVDSKVFQPMYVLKKIYF